jgi:uncharacterized membrane protein
MVTIIYGIVAVVLIALSIPLINGAVGRNHFYGFRTPKTLASDHIWYAANYVLGWDLLWAGIASLISLAVLFTLRHRLSALQLQVLALAIVVTATLVAIAHSFWELSKM